MRRKFRGLEVLLPFEQRVTLPAGQYFVSDLIGCSVFESPVFRHRRFFFACALAEIPKLLGTVNDVQIPGERFLGSPLLEVETSGGEI